jgi:drug/metabolite transporter (DMT)-like permease
MQISEELTAMIVLPIFFLFFLLAIKFFFDWRKVRIKSEFHHKLVDKFGDVKELNTFLETKGGSDFLKSLSINGLAPKEKLLAAVSRGVIVSFLGVAVLILGWVFGENLKYFIAAGITILVLGIGFLVSAAVSYQLSKKWGIIKDE